MAYDTISVIIFFIAGAMILLKIISFVMKTMVTIQNYKESILESSQRKKQRKEAGRAAPEEPEGTETIKPEGN